MPETQKRAALYIRVSTDEQARHGYSLSEQEYDLKQYADRQGYRVIGIYADEGISARKALSRRKGLQRLLEDVEADHVDIIIFKCLDRWFRNIADYYKVQEILDAHHVEWECSQEAIFNTTTTNGKLMLNLKLSLAQHESDQTGDRVRYVFDGRRRDGRVTSGSIPAGYVIDKDKRIQIDERTAPMVREMFRYFVVHRTILGTQRMLREKYGYKRSDSTVGRALQNRLYIGEYHGIKKFCTPLIDEGTFAQAQKVFEGRTRFPRSGNIYMFTGLLHCPSCGRILTPAYRRTRQKVYIYYVCRNSTHGDCPYKTRWREDHIESILLDALEHGLEKYKADIKKAPQTEEETQESPIEELRVKQERLKELYVEGLIPREEFDMRYNDLNVQISSLRPPNEISLVYFKTVSVRDLHEYYTALDKPARKELWSRVLDQVRVSGNVLIPVFRAF